jgi:proline iminopeptidase
MEYALRHPERTSHLVLMSTAPASHDGYRHMRAERQRTAPHDLAQLAALAATHAYLAGDVAADAAYHRVHFASTLPDPDQRERLVTSLRTNFTPRTILLARAIEERLMNETWRLGTYDLLPQLAGLRMPALVLRGEHDLVPEECARRIVAAIRGARFDALDGVGHFCYLEAPEAVHQIVSDFLA